jgi:hypothetical protein
MGCIRGRHIAPDDRAAGGRARPARRPTEDGGAGHAVVPQATLMSLRCAAAVDSTTRSRAAVVSTDRHGA